MIRLQKTRVFKLSAGALALGAIWIIYAARGARAGRYAGADHQRHRQYGHHEGHEHRSVTGHLTVPQTGTAAIALSLPLTNLNFKRSSLRAWASLACCRMPLARARQVFFFQKARRFFAVR